jgi:hypothetical protein
MNEQQLATQMELFKEALVDLIQTQIEMGVSVGFGRDNIPELLRLSFESNFGQLLDDFWPVEVSDPRSIVALMLASEAGRGLPETRYVFADQMMALLVADRIKRQ